MQVTCGRLAIGARPKLDHAGGALDKRGRPALATDMDEPQGGHEQAEKSKGRGARSGGCTLSDVTRFSTQPWTSR